MSAETVHRNHHESHIAYGTGNHNHHRGRLERDGAAVGYSRCDLGTGPLRACPDEPDPLERLLVKLATARGRRDAAPVAEHRPVCDRHDRTRWRLYSERAGWLCLDCRSEKRRVERVGRRISREALRAA
jgi:hypothetical protein